MANIEIRFKCNACDEDYITAQKTITNEIEISTFIKDLGTDYDILLDKPTAIKFAKTIRTEIAKIQDNE